MRYLYACFQGYIGFYTGLGLNKVEIDFTKCRHNIVLISGKNGCGKSTLMNSLSLFPDDSSSFVDFLDGSKTLRLTTGEDIYDIYITSPSDGKGNRKQTKAFIKKNGIELNENGNITSYKDIIFSEFELDSNYISLSKLSCTDRGLGDKKPADRKRFAGSIIDNMEVYNNMYKTLNKKSLVLKSTINNLHTKIQNIGSKETLELSLKTYIDKRNEIQSKIMHINNEIVALQAKYSIDDSLNRSINESYTIADNLKSQIDTANNNLLFRESKFKINRLEIEDKYNEDLKLVPVYEEKIQSLNTQYATLTTNITNLSKNINELQATIETYQANSSINESIIANYKDSEAKIKIFEKELKDYNIPLDSDYTELDRLILLYQDFISLLDILYDNTDLDDMSQISILNQNYILSEEDNKRMLENKLVELNSDIDGLKSDSEALSVLDSRPKNCKIDSCYFISKALDIKKKYVKTSIGSLISAKLEEKDKITYSITETNNKIAYLNSLVPKKTIFDRIRDLISKNESLLMKFNKKFLDTYYNNILKLNPFNDQRDPRHVIDSCNCLKLYKAELNSFEVLKVKYEAIKDQEIIINNNKELLENMNVEIQELNSKALSIKKERDKYEELKQSINTNLDNELSFLEKYREYLELKAKLEEENKKIAEFNATSDKAIQAMQTIAGYKTDLEQLTIDLKPYEDHISTINGQLVLLESYYKEYNEYVEKNNMIETIKKYCSPTGGGIQTIFIQLYMRRTLELSNQILGMLFNGQYRLLDFVINDKEFRIPFVGPSGLPADDISSGSTSQVEMMGMVINLALLYQASTKFNIAYLDEIASGLDNHNQAEFIKVIYYISKYLNMEQVFMICHSLAVDESGVDIIKLADYEEFAASNGNVIYDYKEELSTSQ